MWSNKRHTRHRKNSLRELKQLPRSKFTACWTLLLFCWRRDQNSFFFFFGALIIVWMCCGCLTYLPHLPRALKSNHHPLAPVPFAWKTQLLAWKVSCSADVLCPKEGWFSPRLNAPRVSSWRRLFSAISDVINPGDVTALYTVRAVPFLISGISVGGPCRRSHTCFWMSLDIGYIWWLISLVYVQLKIQLGSLNLF